MKENNENLYNTHKEADNDIILYSENNLKNKNKKNQTIKLEDEYKENCLNSKSNILDEPQKSESVKENEFADNNEDEINRINNALFSRLGKIKVKLVDLDEKVSKELYNSKGKIVPRIEIIELTLLNQGVSIDILWIFYLCILPLFNKPYSHFFYSINFFFYIYL